MRNLVLFVFLVAITQTAFGQWYWGSKSGRSAAVNLTDRIASSKDITIGIGSDDPTTAPKNDTAGSLYLNSTALYRKSDDGSSTNWDALALLPIDLASDVTGLLPGANMTPMVGASGVVNGTQGAVPQPLIANELQFLRGDATWATPTDTGVTAVGTIDSQTKSFDGLVISGSTIYAQNADATHPGMVSSASQTIAGNKTLTGTTRLSGLTGPFPLQIDASEDIVAQAIDLSTTQVTGVLDEPNGGTNQSTYTTGDLLYASGANTLSKRAVGSSGDVLTVVGGLPAWASPAPSGVQSIGFLDTLPKSFDGAAISSSVLYMQTADATHAGLISSQDQTISGAKTFSTPIALNSGGTNKSLTANNGGLVWTDSDSMEITSPGTAGQAVLWGGAGAPTGFNPTTTHVVYGGTGGALADSAGMRYQESTQSLTVGAFIAGSTTVPSRMNSVTTTQKNAISGPVEGNYVWDSDVNKQYNYNGSAWELVTSTADVVVAPGTGTAVYSVVAFGGASATTVCSSSPCTLYGTGLKGEISSVTRSSTGTYAVVMSRTYTNLICHFFARGPSDVIVRQDGGFYGSSTNTIANAIAVTRSGGAPEDSFGSVQCFGN